MGGTQEAVVVEGKEEMGRSEMEIASAYWWAALFAHACPARGCGKAKQ